MSSYPVHTIESAPAQSKPVLRGDVQEEKPYLRALPLEGFRYFKEETHTVQDVSTVQVDDSWYAARPARIGSEVIVRIFERNLEIREPTRTSGQVREHSRYPQRRRRRPDYLRSRRPTSVYFQQST